MDAERREPVDESTGPAADGNDESQQFRAKLEHWRELIVQVDAALLWQKPAIFYTSFAVITAVFLIVWLVEPPVLTLLGVVGLCISLADFAAPAVASRLLSTGEWSGEQERHFEEVVLRLTRAKRQVCDAFDTLMFWKVNKPAIYLVVTVGTLLVVAWLGSCIHNLWLAYIFVAVALLLPGAIHHGVFERYLQLARSRFQALLSKLKKTKKQQ